MRPALLGTAVVTTIAGLALVPSSDAAAPSHATLSSTARAVASATKPGPTATKFGFSTQAFGSKVDGASLPAGSNTTAFEGIGCTNRAGLTRTNNVATAALPGGVGDLKGVYTQNYTEQVGSTVSAVSVHNVARVVLGETPLGSLELTGVNSTSRASHDAAGFHATTDTSIASILLRPAAGPPVKIDIPTIGQQITIPGVATISVPGTVHRVGPHGATAAADTVDITIIATKTRVRVSHTVARLSDGVTIGTFRGMSNATQVRALSDDVRSGPNPLSLMPCVGTFGHTPKKDLAAAHLAKIVDVSGARSSQSAQATANRASGFESAHIAKVDIGDGALVIKGITARANVARTRRVISDVRGTSVLSFASKGRAENVVDLDGFEIPGLLKVATNVVTHTANGIDVVAVRVTLLDGSGAVVDLAHANLQIRPAPRG